MLPHNYKSFIKRTAPGGTVLLYYKLKLRLFVLLIEVSFVKVELSYHEFLGNRGVCASHFHDSDTPVAI